MSKKRWIILGIVTGVVGAFYEFVSRKTIKSLSEFLLFDVDILGHRVRHNDLILVGTILLIISFVSFYKVYRLITNNSAQISK
ncbi:hypothetical protein HY483_04085 [Candidatus Woesearchaeota archaeon]|nr:hypothetical protein [Candidatus Woesearchaeota archaeon]